MLDAAGGLQQDDVHVFCRHAQPEKNPLCVLVPVQLPAPAIMVAWHLCCCVVLCFRACMFNTGIVLLCLLVVVMGAHG